MEWTRTPHRSREPWWGAVPALQQTTSAWPARNGPLQRHPQLEASMPKLKEEQKKRARTSEPVRKPKWAEEHVPMSGGRWSTGSRHTGGSGQRHHWPTVVHHATTALSLRWLHARWPVQIWREDDGSGHGGTGSARFIGGLRQQGRPSR